MTVKAMDELKKKGAMDADKEIIFSKSIKAGKRIYYLDVKKNRKEEMFLTITESKKRVSGEGEDSQVSFEKHKIFLYREDFEKFMGGLADVMHYITNGEPARKRMENSMENSGKDEPEAALTDEEIKIDIDF